MEKFAAFTGKSALAIAIAIGRLMLLLALFVWACFYGGMCILTRTRPVFGLFIIAASLVLIGVLYLLSDKLIEIIMDLTMKKTRGAGDHGVYSGKRSTVLVKCRCGKQFPVGTEANGEWFGPCPRCGTTLHVNPK